MKESRSGLAGETWELLFELVTASRPHLPAAAAACGLTPAQCEVLRRLEPGTSLPMCRLAERLGCDASNVTGIVDRLETRGLVTRRPAGHDRRVKELALTRAGVSARARLLEHLTTPPAPITRLSAPDQEALCAILRKALGKPSRE
jgi:MarR family transcriptional regulator, organic hydroperoxide resistance regulator